MKGVLIFAYYSFKDPVFQSAVLPYFQGLKTSTNFVLLTFEKDHLAPSEPEISEISELLSKDNIKWYRLKWHSGRLKFFKKIFDLTWGVLRAIYLINKHRLRAIYSEGFPGAVIGYFVCKLTGLPHLVHTFEPHVDYMLEASVWQPKDWEARLLKYYQPKVAAAASHIFTATQGMVDLLQTQGVSAKITRLPSCVDPGFYFFDQTKRNQIRNKLRIQNELVILYMGKFGGMYMDEEMFNFFRRFEEKGGDSCRFIILTPEPIEDIQQKVLKTAINVGYYTVTNASREEVPGYLSAADFGLTAVRQFPSKRYCSPIKDGEYWACELPILIFKGISDDFLLTEEKNLGFVLEDTSLGAYDQAIEQVFVLHADQEYNKLVRKKCREFVIEDRSIGYAREIYNDIFENI